MVHSVSGCSRCVQVKLWDPLRTRAIPERLEVCSQRGAIQIHVYLYLYLYFYLWTWWQYHSFVKRHTLKTWQTHCHVISTSYMMAHEVQLVTSSSYSVNVLASYEQHSGKLWKSNSQRTSLITVHIGVMRLLLYGCWRTLSRSLSEELQVRIVRAAAYRVVSATIGDVYVLALLSKCCFLSKFHVRKPSLVIVRLQLSGQHHGTDYQQQSGHLTLCRISRTN